MAISIKDVTLDQINSFIKNGNPANAPQEIIDYLDLMDKVRGMYLRNGDFGTKNSIINHLTKVEKLSYYLAVNLYNNTIEYFYCSTKISKAAWRNVYAEKLDQQIAFAQEVQANSKDAKAVADIIKIAMSARELDEVDIPELPAHLFEKPFKLYGMDPSFVGLEPINRNRLAQIIDELPDVSERQKERIKQDAAIVDITIFQDEQEDVRKQE